jgi:hypothetical protein
MEGGSTKEREGERGFFRSIHLCYLTTVSLSNSRESTQPALIKVTHYMAALICIPLRHRSQGVKDGRRVSIERIQARQARRHGPPLRACAGSP